MDTVISVESRIYNENTEILENYCKLSSYIYRKIFNEINNNKDYNYNELQKQCRLENNVHVRLFKSLHILASGQILSQKELTKDYIKETESKLVSLHDQLRKTNPKRKKQLHWLNVKIDKLTNKLRVLNKKKNKPVEIMFGTKELYYSQFPKKENTSKNKKKGIDYSKDHDSWLVEWRRKRDNHLYFVGSKDENCGNNLCQLKDLSTLRVTLPKCINNNGRYLTLDVDFDHKGRNYDLLKIAILNRQALTYTITQKDNHKWYVSVSFKITSVLNENNYDGCIGIDTNYGLFTTTSVKNDGNPDYFEDYNYNPETMTSNEITHELSRIVGLIVDRSKEENRYITVEDLDFKNKKSIDNGTVTNRKLHMIPYSKFFKLLVNRCIKENILISFINPCYTSVIAKYKYSKNYGRSIHSLSSFVIGRRGMGFGERVPHGIQEKVQSGQKHSVKSWEWNSVSRKLGKSYPSGFSLRSGPCPPLKINLSPASRCDNSMSYPFKDTGEAGKIKRSNNNIINVSDKIV